MKTLICGSRENFDEEKAEDYLKELIRWNKTDTFIHGGAKGVDTLADEILKRYGCNVERVVPDYDVYGHDAPIVRNRTMVQMADRVVAFWNFKSRGTRFTLEYARKLKKPVDIVDIRASADNKDGSGVSISQEETCVCGHEWIEHIINGGCYHYYDEGFSKFDFSKLGQYCQCNEFVKR